MLAFAVLLVAISGSLAQGNPTCGKKPDQNPWDERIVGGDDADSGAWPWQLSLQGKAGSQWLHTCGAVLLTEEWVLTAAHCVHGRADPANFRILAGGRNLTGFTGSEQILELSFIFEHEDFKMNPLLGFPNDIALIKLAEKADLTTDEVGVACVADETMGDFSDNDNCWITGWGLTHWLNDQVPDILQEAHIKVPTNEECKAVVATLRESHICAGNGRPNACRGDSGGPMSCKVGDKWYVTGVTSFGPVFCAIIPGVYTRVSSFNDWINSTMTYYGNI